MAQSTRFHTRNKNKDPYDLEAMTVALPELASFITPNPKGEKTINFSDALAIRALNKAILKHYYKIDYWEFPLSHLTPPIPGRADYLHHIADFLLSKGHNIEHIQCIDIGTGASCIYPIIGVIEYNWKFLASDIDKRSLKTAQAIIAKNKLLSHHIQLRLQAHKHKIFEGIIKPNEQYDITICNPPFYKSRQEAETVNKNRIRKMTGKVPAKSERNFSGTSNELIYPGGELKFIQQMVSESFKIKTSVRWFSTLISNKYHLKKIKQQLEQTQAKTIELIDLKTANKVSRIIVWSYQ